VKILLVDDDLIARKIVSAMLKHQGHQVVEAPDGESAWRLVKDGDISCVVSDWVMPGLSGVDLCRRIRAAGLSPYVYVILCTSRGEKSDLIEGMDAGADDFLVKPVAADELRVKVRAGERVICLQQGLADKNQELAIINNQLQTSHKRIEDDLKAAAWMQKTLLPAPLVEANGFRCNWRFEPSGYVAGDIFNFFPMDEQAVGFYLLDVSGHGVPAAMLSVTLSMMLTPEIARGSPLKRSNSGGEGTHILSPDVVIRDLNRRFQSRDDQYFTMLYGLIDPSSSTFRLAQAGHPGPVLIEKNGRVKILGSGGMPIGVLRDIEFDCFEVPVCKGDRLLLYSDGVTECINQDGEGFGEQRLLEYLASAASKQMDGLLGGLLQELGEWRHGAESGDDISLLAIEVTGSRSTDEAFNTDRRH
jgi:sigma-B regulation protein RsbU (phosphoserine phosphatase)